MNSLYKDIIVCIYHCVPYTSKANFLITCKYIRNTIKQNVSLHARKKESLQHKLTFYRADDLYSVFFGHHEIIVNSLSLCCLSVGENYGEFIIRNFIDQDSILDRTHWTRLLCKNLHYVLAYLVEVKNVKIDALVVFREAEGLLCMKGKIHNFFKWTEEKLAEKIALSISSEKTLKDIYVPYVSLLETSKELETLADEILSQVDSFLLTNGFQSYKSGNKIIREIDENLCIRILRGPNYISYNLYKKDFFYEKQPEKGMLLTNEQLSKLVAHIFCDKRHIPHIRVSVLENIHKSYWTSRNGRDFTLFYGTNQGGRVAKSKRKHFVLALLLVRKWATDIFKNKLIEF